MTQITSENYKRKQEKIFASLVYRDLQQEKKKLIRFLENYEQKGFKEDLEVFLTSLLVSLPTLISKKAKQVLTAGYTSGKQQFKEKTSGFDINWGLRNDEATVYINNLTDLHLSQRKGSISRTTKLGIIEIIDEGITDGLSYQQIGKKIREKDPVIFSKARSELIAIQETGRAYEKGNNIIMQELYNKGEVIKKKWITAGDEKVRPAHQMNGADGWIDIKLPFSGTSSDIAPTGFRCRCSTIYDII